MISETPLRVRFGIRGGVFFIAGMGNFVPAQEYMMSDDEFFDEFCLGYDEGPDESWILFHDPDDDVFVADEVLCLVREGW